MSIIEMYVKNRPQQLFGYIIIPVTSVVHSVPIPFVVSLPNATKNCTLFSDGSCFAERYRNEMFFPNNFFSSHL